MLIYSCTDMRCSDTIVMTISMDELLLNTQVCVYTHHHRWYFCSQSCFLFPISHSRVRSSYVHKLEWIQNSDIFRADGTWRSRAGNLRERSLCFLDQWGQGQEVSRRTVRHTGAKVLFCWKNDAWDALVFLGRRFFTRIVHNSLSGYWWQAWTEANWTVFMV